MVRRVRFVSEIFVVCFFLASLRMHNMDSKGHAAQDAFYINNLLG
jgi:hypothetical protein